MVGTLMLAFGSTALAATESRVLDDFSELGAWTAGASEDVKATAVRRPGGGVCLRYDFGRVSGYAVLRRALPLDLPAHYALVLRLSGKGPANAFQFKLVDAGGDNVWWYQQPAFKAPRQPTDLKMRRREITFAWGPTSQRELKQAATIELVVASGPGGRGELCFERLTLQTLPLPKDAVEVRQNEGETAGRRFREMVFSQPRELNGVMLHAPAGGTIAGATLQVMDDTQHWRPVARIPRSSRNTLPLWLAQTETTAVRVIADKGEPPQIEAADVNTWRTPNDMLAALARTQPRGRMPRAFLNEQNYWTLVGIDGGGAQAALMSEDGAIEPRKAGPSVEPFIVDEAGRTVSWADVGIEHSLRENHLPIPQVRWAADDVALTVEAAGQGAAGQTQTLAHYTLRNPMAAPRSVTLVLAIRPWQVNPPQQFLNTAGGIAPISRLTWSDNQLLVNGRVMLKTLDQPDAVEGAAFERDDLLDPAKPGPKLTTLTDARGLASARLRWRIELPPGASRTIALALPAGPQIAPPQPMEATAAAWHERLNRVQFAVPPSLQPIVDTLRTALAHILISRDGVALQPGTRSYARSWIRDGAMMTTSLLRLGEVNAARDFVNGYAKHLFANGKVPCCVDARGADPVAENDSHGQFIHAVAEVWRYTGDDAFARALWPQVDAAARYMEQLRQSERIAANHDGERSAFFGMMPASISHEGYSAKPMHSYWDNFWALAGWRSAAQLAAAFGSPTRTAELTAQRDEFRNDLAASLRAAVAQHRIDHLPGAAELGDFDPSSSTMIFNPAGAESLVPPALLQSTWSRYWQHVTSRRDGSRDWDDYTPYELRSASAFLHLNQPERARGLLDDLMRDRRPAGWNGWAEVVGRDPRKPRFVGDMPHAWISSDFIRAALDLFAYERESDQALVLGAGLSPDEWKAASLAVRGLRTPWGAIDWRITAGDGASRLRVEVKALTREPPGGVWLAWPPSRPRPVARVGGRTLSWTDSMLRLPSSGAELTLELRDVEQPTAR
jgi:hypothetical protein